MNRRGFFRSLAAAALGAAAHVYAPKTLDAPKVQERKEPLTMTEVMMRRDEKLAALHRQRMRRQLLEMRICPPVDSEGNMRPDWVPDWRDWLDPTAEAQE